MKYIVGIDPGNTYTGFCICDEDLKPVLFGKQANEFVYLRLVEFMSDHPGDTFEYAIEMIASYGMPVGREVFETVRWIGILSERLRLVWNIEAVDIYRKDEKMAICHSQKANDATIRQALVDRFAYNVPNKGKGTKKEPGWFYGFRADVWQAYAVAVTYHDRKG